MDMGNQNVLELRRPRSRAAITFAVCAVAAAAAVFFVFFVMGIAVQTLMQRILKSLLFAVLWLVALFCAGAALSSLRDLFEAPTAILDSETLNICGREPIRLCEISRMQVEGGAGKAKGLRLTLENGDNVFVKQHCIDIPAETLKYAIEIRKK